MPVRAGIPGDDPVTNTRPFPLAVVLSTYHNKLMCPFAEFRKFLNYMAGTDVAMWEIPRARSLAAGYLVTQFPWLPKVAPPPGFKFDANNTTKFVRKVAEQIGAFTLDVKPMIKGRFLPHRPFTTPPYAKRS